MQPETQETRQVLQFFLGVLLNYPIRAKGIMTAFGDNNVVMHRDSNTSRSINNLIGNVNIGF